MKRSLKKFLIIPVVAITIVLVLSLFYPQSVKEIPSKINEIASDIGEALSKGIPAIFSTPSNESTENKTENRTAEAPGGPGVQYLVPNEEGSEINLSMTDVQCNHFFKIQIRNDGSVGVDFSNADFYYKDYKLNVTLSTLYLSPNEVEEILIPLYGGMPIPQREPWKIDIILKDSQNSTFFTSSFIVFCIL